MKKHIYADNAATTQLDAAAFEAMTPWLLEEYGNASQPYSFARNPKMALSESRSVIAECIGADPEEVFFTSGGTESDNWVIKGTAFGNMEKKAIITSSFEHHAILHACSAIEKLGYPVAYMSPTHEGYITPDILKKHITEQTKLVSVMYANNEIGTVQPIEDLCRTAHASGAMFHTDAVQAVGHVNINVHKLGVDFLSASAHKFNGPKGIGFLFIRKGAILNPLVDGGAQERNMRAGTENIASIVGMAVALKENYRAIEENQKHLTELERVLLSKLNASGISYKRNGGKHMLPGLLSLSFEGKDGEAILHRMDLSGICISTGSACDSQNKQISHVLNSIGQPENLAMGTIRISFGRNNTIEHAEIIAQELVKIVSG